MSLSAWSFVYIAISWFTGLYFPHVLHPLWLLKISILSLELQAEGFRGYFPFRVPLQIKSGCETVHLFPCAAKEIFPDGNRISAGVTVWQKITRSHYSDTIFWPVVFGFIPDLWSIYSMVLGNPSTIWNVYSLREWNLGLVRY